MASARSMDMDQYIDQLEGWFGKLPPLPDNIRELLVTIAPWLALVFGVLGVLASIAATGFLAVLSPFVALGGGLGMAAGGIVGALLALVGSVLMLAAFPGLKDRKAQGWKLSFWSEVVSVVSSVVALNLVGAVVGALIGFYLLFSIKKYYK